MGRVICLLGTDGSGKSTLSKEIAKKIDGKVVYFGWRPFLWSTKLISWIFKKKNYRIAESMNKSDKKFSLVQEIMLVYYYIEYVFRYIFQVAFRGTVVLDRYFYDMYSHYDYASRSKVFKVLMKIFPKPDYLFFLDVDVDIAKKRKPEMDITLLKMHKKKYLELVDILKIEKIDCSKSIGACVSEIIKRLK